MKPHGAGGLRVLRAGWVELSGGCVVQFFVFTFAALQGFQWPAGNDSRTIGGRIEIDMEGGRERVFVHMQFSN